jgi:glycosyltransferase involved in cell wall biosynthesis
LKESANGPELSIVVPAYNEEARIEPTLERVREWLSARGEAAEVLVVDDGSRDATPRVVEREVERYRESGLALRLLGDGANHGKGASVRTGMLAARGRVALFTDADLSSPIEEAPKLLDPIRAGAAAVAIGSRGLDKSMIGVHQPAGRELAGRAFNLVMRVATGLPFKDTQCGFKAFRRDAARAVFSRVRIERFGFDVEALYVARKLGYATLEVPVVWNNVEGSKVSFASGLNGFLDIARVRANDLRGLYDEPAVASPVSSVAE